ncbi:diaminopimelate epimerase [Blattabacterium cuenoti]|uniref:diaminopimelate epimerase n=1 Tax=Blattabacterium cuenoti TaxID=1653831 RepID=UPI00163C9179|nr:diaminopimelate epimerase [Blattabacterium cuenoti]
MKLSFYKYQGTGNDFILLDYRKEGMGNPFLFKRLCDRHFGIGADGIIFIKNDNNSDFYMKYCNSDGIESTMCGNGGRCAISFAHKLGIKKKEDKIYFRAMDGYHVGFINNQNLVSINMLNIDKNAIEIHSEYVFLNTGSPHHILFVEHVAEKDVYKEGKKIRSQSTYLEEGVNVNFVEILEDQTLKVRTYERGVENETLSCGTGVVASVIAACETNKIKNGVENILVKTLGGKLWVSFKKTKNEYQEIYLTGNVQFIFEGCITI